MGMRHVVQIAVFVFDKLGLSDERHDEQKNTGDVKRCQ